MSRTSKSLSPTQEIILKTLRKNGEPLSAYALLEKVRKFEIKSPPIVYRALGSLIESGKVHKINELNTFIACNCDDDHEHSLSVLTICKTCKNVSEIHDHAVIDNLTKLKSLKINLVKHAVIEIPIVCEKCVAL